MRVTSARSGEPSSLVDERDLERAIADFDLERRRLLGDGDLSLLCQSVAPDSALFEADPLPRSSSDLPALAARDDAS